MLTSLNKYISQTGYCSRREADLLIADGRVTVNEMMGTVAMRIADTDVVCVDFEEIKTKKKEEVIVLAYHKPPGLNCTMDTADKSSMMNFIKYPKRVFPIGRLDKDSEGLLLLTNNGDIVNKILRSDNNHEKEYWVTLTKPYDKNFLAKMEAGVRIDVTTTTKECKTKPISPRRFSITLTQGLNRQIRKMCKELDYRVESLMRVRIMNVFLGNIGPGKFKRLSEVELNTLLDSVKYSSKTENVSVKKHSMPKPKFSSASPKFFAKEIAQQAAAEKQRLAEKPKREKVEKKPKPAAKKVSTSAAPSKGSYKAFRESRSKK